MDRFLRYCFVCLVSLSPLAFSAERVIVVEPSQLQRSFTPGQSPYAFSDARNWSQPVSTQSGRINLPVSKKGNYNFSTFRNGLKNALKVNPASLALNAAIAGAVTAAGLLIDSATNSLRKNESTLDGLPVTNLKPSPGYVPAGLCENYPAASTFGKVTIYNNPYGYPSGTVVAARVVAWNPVSTGGWFRVTTCPYPGRGYVAVGGYFPMVENKVISSSDINNEPRVLSDAEIQSFADSFNSPVDASLIAPDVISAVPGSYDYPDGTAFDGPESITGDPVVTTTTTPTGTEVSTTTPTYNFDYSTNPLSITTTTTNTTTVYNNGTLVSTTTTTNNQGVVDAPAAEQLDIPTDCEFMPTVCAWLEWFKTPAPMPEPDMPQVVDDEFRQEYTVSFGGSCPAPRTVDTQFGTLSLSWQPLCDLASIIRYLVIASASLYAAFIGLGISRGSR